MIVSACLLGVACRYDGGDCFDKALCDELGRGNIIPVCPEQLGGLATPREPAFLTGGDGYGLLDGKARVLTRSGTDLTAQFLSGAEQVLKIAGLANSDGKAFLKEGSPSCGVAVTTVDDEKRPGHGVLAARLERAGYTVIGRSGA